MSDTAGPAPLPRRPLRVWSGYKGDDGVLYDGFTVVRDGDPGYEEAYEYAARMHREYGQTPDWATDQDLPAERPLPVEPHTD